MLDESDLLLDLLREAGDEPVTLDELHVVGVREPAQALLALELAGHSVHRVYDNRVQCIRLGAPMPTPDPEPASAPAPAAPAAAGPDLRVVLAAVLGVLLLVLLSRRD